MAIQAELRRVVEERETLSSAAAAALMRRILDVGNPDAGASDVEFAALLGALAGRGEAAGEIAGFATAMREAAAPFPLSLEEREQLVDTCGTGGDGSGTFNISTAAALVAAAAGARVAKHGNRAITSQSGSADVLEALEIPTQLAPEAAATMLRKVGFCFLLAPAHHPAMRGLLPVRRALGVRTILHVLGPLLNPAGARRQVMGVYQARLVPLVAEAMILLGTQHAMVVHGDSGKANGQSNLDEFSLSGPTEVAEVLDGTVQRYTVSPEQFGLKRVPLSALQGGDAAVNADILTAIFAGEGGPKRDIVRLNAAAVLMTAGLAKSMDEGLALAAHAIDSRAVARLIEELRHGQDQPGL